MPGSDVFGIFGEIDFRLDPKKTALIIIDMQYLDAHRDYGMGADAKRLNVTAKYDYYFNQLDTVVIPNTKRLLDVCRKGRHSGRLPADRIAREGLPRRQY